MNKKFGLVALVISALLVSSVSAIASGALEQPVSKPFQITTDPHYDRNPSLFQANDGTYWLFFARGRSPIGIRGASYDPDSDSYDIYYKTAKSLPGLQKAQEIMVPGSNSSHGQRDVAALQANDGKIWVFSSTGFGLGENQIYYFNYYDGSWQGPVAIDIDVQQGKWIGHIDALEYDGKIWVFYDAEYSLKAVYYDEGSWHGPFGIASDATLGKAIVDNGIFYVVWSYVDPDLNIWGGYIGLSTSDDDGNSWDTYGPIASWLGATNWDPVLIKDKNTFRLFWAPDTGIEGQFIATSKSTNPTGLSSWSTPVRVTTASYGDNKWWDFWPEPYKKGRGCEGSLCMFYTSERNSDGTEMIDGNIWMFIAVPLAND